MSVDEYEAALSAFITALKQAWYAAGKPSYINLQQLSEQVRKHRRSDGVELLVLTKSTAHGTLSGRGVRPPKWPLVLTFVTVLHAAARRAGIDPARIGTVGEWKRRHEALCAAEQAAERPVNPRGRHAKPSPHRAGVLSRTAALASLEVVAPHADGDVAEDAWFDEVLGRARRTDRPQWWCGYHDVAPEWLELYLHLESLAEVIRTYESQVIPGLLQVEDYAHAVLARCRPDATAREITRLAELRMNRQWVLRNRRSCQLWAIVEETALRNQPVDRATMQAQIRYLIEVADQPNIRLQVLPPGTGDNLTINQPITVFRFPEPHSGDVVCIEQPSGGLFLRERKDAVHYNQLLSRLGIRAPKQPDKVTDLLRQILADI